MLSRERFISYGLILLLGSALIYFVLIGDEEYVEDDGNIYIRGDLYFNYHVYSDKFICENHKGI